MNKWGFYRKSNLSFFKKWSSVFFSQLLIFKMEEHEERRELVFF